MERVDIAKKIALAHWRFYQLLEQNPGLDKDYWSEPWQSLVDVVLALAGLGELAEAEEEEDDEVYWEFYFQAMRDASKMDNEGAMARIFYHFWGGAVDSRK